MIFAQFGIPWGNSSTKPLTAKNIAPDIPLKDVIWGVMPFVGLMFVAIILCCFFPAIATAFPDAVMGVTTK